MTLTGTNLYQSIIPQWYPPALPDYVFDMHTREGVCQGKPHADFALTGAFIIDEDKTYFNQLYRDFNQSCHGVYKIKDK